MKKLILKKILFYICILIILFIIVNSFLYVYICIRNNVNIADNTQNIFKKEPFSITNCLKDQSIGAVSNQEYSKNGIIIFGCGFASGLNLEKNQNFATKLSNATQRPVYNYGIPGGYIQHSILAVQSNAINEIIRNSDYAIYISSTIDDGYRLETFPGSY